MPNKTSREEVYRVIDGERDYQENLPSNRSENAKRIRMVSEYLTMLDHYVRHAQDAWTTRAGIEVPLEDMRKIGALAVRCMEEWGAPPRVVNEMEQIPESAKEQVFECGPFSIENVTVDAASRLRSKAIQDDTPEVTTSHAETIQELTEQLKDRFVDVILKNNPTEKCDAIIDRISIGRVGSKRNA